MPFAEYVGEIHLLMTSLQVVEMSVTITKQSFVKTTLSQVIIHNLLMTELLNLNHLKRGRLKGCCLTYRCFLCSFCLFLFFLIP